MITLFNKSAGSATSWRSFGLGAAMLLSIGVGGVIAVRANAAGVPDMKALTYTGYIETPDGKPVTAKVNILVNIYDAATDGTKVCEQTVMDLTPVSGRFQVELPEACTVAVKANPNLWIEAVVNGSALGRTKLGAVPYALEAGSASQASGPLEQRLASLMPPKTIIHSHLIAADIAAHFEASGLAKVPGPYAGWAICNGMNGTPDLNGRFLRVNGAGAGAVGGSDTSDHTHSIAHDHAAVTSAAEAGHTHSVPNHQHLLPLGYDPNWVFYAVDSGYTPVFGSGFETLVRSALGMGGTGVFGNGAVRLAYTRNDGGGNTGVGTSHSHSVDLPALSQASGAASNTENRPAYVELVALMRL